MTCLWKPVRCGLSSKIWSLQWPYLLLLPKTLQGGRERCTMFSEHWFNITTCAPRSSWLLSNLFMWDGNSCFLLPWIYPMTRDKKRTDEKLAKGCANLLRTILVIVTRWSLQGRLFADSQFPFYFILIYRFFLLFLIPTHKIVAC